MNSRVSYLEEQRDTVLGALRDSRDLILGTRAAKKPWETTLWTRTAEDSKVLLGMMRESVVTTVREAGVPAVVTLALVEAHEVDPEDAASGGQTRWGVRLVVQSPGGTG